MTPERQQIIPGLPFGKYKAIDALNMSLFKELVKSPGQLDYRRHNPKPVTPAMLHGSAIGCLALEPHLFDEQYAVKPEDLDLRYKDGKAWAAEHEGKHFVPHTVPGAAGAVLGNELARALIFAGQIELTLVWERTVSIPGGGETYLWCKGRPDIYIPQVGPHLAELLRAKCGQVDPVELPEPGDSLVVDLKSTGKGVDPKSVSKLAYDGNWYRQAPWYMDGLTNIKYRDHHHAAHIVVEQEEPHHVDVYPMPLEYIEKGRMKNHTELEKYVHWLNAGEWPTSSGKLQVMTWPRWAE